MRHTQSASTNVMIEPTSTASQAGQRNTASRISSETTGMSATRQVSVRLLSGSISCVNMISPWIRGAAWTRGGWRRGALVFLLGRLLLVVRDRRILRRWRRNRSTGPRSAQQLEGPSPGAPSRRRSAYVADSHDHHQLRAHLPQVWTSIDRNDADRCVHVLSRVRRLRGGLAASPRRLLRVLLLRFGSLSSIQANSSCCAAQTTP